MLGIISKIHRWLLSIKDILTNPDFFDLDRISYRSVRHFTTDLYRTSISVIRGTAPLLILVAMPIAVYLTTSNQSPYRRDRAASPTRTPTVSSEPTPTISPSPTPTPTRTPTVASEPTPAPTLPN